MTGAEKIWDFENLGFRPISYKFLEKNREKKRKITQTNQTTELEEVQKWLVWGASPHPPLAGGCTAAPQGEIFGVIAVP